MLRGASMRWLIVTAALHSKEMGSGGVDRVLLAVGLCEDSTKQLGSIEGGQ